MLGCVWHASCGTGNCDLIQYSLTMCTQLHPDKNVQCSDDEKKRRAELFQKVDGAYRLLADSAVREGVNAQIASEW